ncbi:hypothetical protein quinque_002276 [Culex quinquefasciatus]
MQCSVLWTRLISLRKEVLRGYFYRSKNDENDTVLGYLESQNDNLDTSAWRILRRSGKNDHVEWAFTIDTASMKLLEEQKFVVNYKFGQTMFRRKQAETGSHPADDDSDEDMEVDHFDEGLSAEAQVGDEMAQENESSESSDGTRSWVVFLLDCVRGATPGSQGRR